MAGFRDVALAVDSQKPPSVKKLMHECGVGRTDGANGACSAGARTGKVKAIAGVDTIGGAQIIAEVETTGGAAATDRLGRF